MNRSKAERPGGNGSPLPPPWALITAALAGLTAFVWFNPINWSNIGDVLGAIAGLVCFVGLVSFVLWGVAAFMVVYVRNLRIALPLTAGGGLVGVILWQVFDGLSPTGKFVMIAVIVLVVTAMLFVLEHM